MLSLLGDVFSGGGWYPAGFLILLSFVRSLFVCLVLCEFLLFGGIFSPESDKYFVPFFMGDKIVVLFS